MPIVKVKKAENFLRQTANKIVPVAPTAPAAPNVYMTAYANQLAIGKLELGDFFEFASIAWFNDGEGGTNFWFEDLDGLGCAFYVASDRRIFFDAQEVFDSLVAPASAVVRFSYVIVLNEQTYQGFVYCTVLAATPKTDSFWNSVAFLYQLPPTIYAVTDRKGNYSTTAIGDVNWVWDSLFRDAIMFKASPKSQLAVGSVDDFRFLCNGTTSWTFDGWFFPAQWSGMHLLGLSENNSSKSTFFIRYSPFTLTVTWQTASATLMNWVIPIYVPANDWQHYAFVYHAPSNSFQFWLNGVYVDGVMLSGTPSNDPVGQLYVGGRFASANDNWRGRTMGIRLTKAARWYGDDDYVFTPPLPLFPEV
jgi:hypothetical protein